MNGKYLPRLLVCSVAVWLSFCNSSGPVPTLRDQPYEAESAPQLIYQSPTSLEELPLNGTISLYFDQPMDRESVEQALVIEPDFAFELAWLDSMTLQIDPATQALSRATRYRLTIDERARSRDGIAVDNPIVAEVKTVGYLGVSEVIPAPGATSVDPDSVITVLFNRPVVPLTIEPADDLPQPLDFEPDIAGEGEWLNTSIYVWRPNQPLAAGQPYQVSIRPDLLTSADAIMQHPFTWAFTTLAPAVSWVRPANQAQTVPLDAVVEVYFNQSMDRASVEEGVSLLGTNIQRSRGQTDESWQVRGSFDWNDEGDVLTFTPDRSLSYDAAYELKIESTARAEHGSMTLAEDFTWSFETVHAPAVKGTAPANGADDVSPVWGWFYFAFTAPMDEETLLDKLVVEPALPDDAAIYYDTSRWLLMVEANLEPSTEYTVTLLPGAADPYGRAITGTHSFHFTTGPFPPLVQLNIDNRFNVYDVREAPELLALVRNVDRIHVQLAQLPIEDFGRLSQDWEAFADFQPPHDQVVRSWTIDTEAPLNTGFYWRIPLEPENGESLAAGVYLLTIRSPDLERPIRHFIILANANVTYKPSFTESLAWVTDLHTGEPLSNVRVTFFDEAFRPIGQGQTGPDGVVTVETALQPDLMQVHTAVVQDGNVFGVAQSNWTNNIELWALGVGQETRFRPYSLYLYTDRPLYRPGQPVYFKGILRSRDDLTYTLPDATDVLVSIHSPNDEVVYSETLRVSDFGTLDGSFTLGPEAATGYYRVEYSVPDGDGDETNDYAERTSFWVAEYQKPSFTVTATAEQESVEAGDPARVTVEANHFFGGPVSQAWVAWRILAQPYSFEYQGQERFSFLDYDREQPLDDATVPGYGRLIAEGEGQLDEEGRLVVDLPTDLTEFDSSQRFTVEVLVGDGSDQWVAALADVVVHKSAVYVGVRPDSYVGAIGESQTGHVITLNPDGHLVADQAVTVEIIQRRWYSVQEENEDGYTHWVTDVEEIPLGPPMTLQTDEQGRASFNFVPPAGGSYEMIASTTDSQGRTVRSSAFVWTGSSGFIPWARRNSRTIELVPDKSTYQPGETARVLIASPFAEGDIRALVTVERGSILHHEVITLTSNSYVYELPITGAYAPNAYVSVVVLQSGSRTAGRQPDFRVGFAEIRVEPIEQALQVIITPSTNQAEPGEDVTYTIETYDASGEPVDAEVSLALVDRATLSLMDGRQSTLLDYFYRRQYLGVLTSLSVVYLVDPLDQSLLDQAKGGGGGGDEGFYDVRSEFKDTAYWQAAVRTGVDGRAAVTVTLPDNLTTWRMDARAVTADTRVGQATVDIVVAKPLMVRPVTPRFFVVGDQPTLAAIVYNQTAAPLEGMVRLDAVGVTLHADAVQTITIPAGGQATAEWPVVVQQDATWIDLTFSAEAGALQDSSKPLLGDPDHAQMMPVYRYTAPDTIGTAGQLPDTQTRIEHVVLPPGYATSQGELVIQIDPSLATSMLDGLTWLEHYPYECTEQTVSRFLPNALTLQALRQVGIADPELESSLNTQLDIGIQKLYSQQHVDGGWGWFVDRESQPGVTAYVVQGLVAAQAAGYPVDAGRLANAVGYLQGQLQPVDTLRTHSERNRQTYVLYVLTTSGQPDASRTVQMFEARDGVDLWARALLAQTLWMIDNHDPRLETLKSDLVNAAVLSATGVHWEESQRDYSNWNTDTRTTAIVLDTFAQLWPDSELLPGITRWLMANRRGGHWSTTQETAWALIALTSWMVATRELEADYEWSLSLNGNDLEEGASNTSPVGQSTVVTVPATDLLVGETNRLAFQRTGGSGQLYYTAHLTLYQPVESIEPISRGIVVTRRYLDRKGDPIEEGQLGDVVTVEVTLIAPQDLHYVVVEDYYPAGAEPINRDFVTSGITGQRPYLEPSDPLAGGWGWWWFSHIELRDEKAVVYADFLPSGTYQFLYEIRLAVPGEYHVLPPTAQEFYFPEIYGRGGGALFTVNLRTTR